MLTKFIKEIINNLQLLETLGNCLTHLETIVPYNVLLSEQYMRWL